MTTTIETVKYAGEGYLVNGEMSVPKAEGNRHYTELLEWVAEGGVIAPEYTQSELDTAATNLINTEARMYLATTDWYVTRFMETAVAVPDTVSAERAAARASIV